MLCIPWLRPNSVGTKGVGNPNVVFDKGPSNQYRILFVIKDYIISFIICILFLTKGLLIEIPMKG